jgi:hypothetical protein
MALALTQVVLILTVFQGCDNNDKEDNNCAICQEHADLSEQALAKAKTRSRAGSIGPVGLKKTLQLIIPLYIFVILHV